MTWKEKASLIRGKRRQHSTAAKKGHKKRKIKKKLKNWVMKKIISSAIGLPNGAEIIEDKK